MYEQCTVPTWEGFELPQWGADGRGEVEEHQGCPPQACYHWDPVQVKQKKTYNFMTIMTIMTIDITVSMPLPVTVATVTTMLSWQLMSLAILKSCIDVLCQSDIDVLWHIKHVCVRVNDVEQDRVQCIGRRGSFCNFIYKCTSLLVCLWVVYGFERILLF